jgi:hypothetical protein
MEGWHPGALDEEPQHERNLPEEGGLNVEKRRKLSKCYTTRTKDGFSGHPAGHHGGISWENGFRPVCAFAHRRDGSPRGGLEAVPFGAFHHAQTMLVSAFHLTWQIEITSGNAHGATILLVAPDRLFSLVRFNLARGIRCE